MGELRLALDPPTVAEQDPDLGMAYVSGLDRTPWRTDVEVVDGVLVCRRMVDESGRVFVPWNVPGFGRTMISTATLVERDRPYNLAIELARGKLNDLRHQIADWTGLGIRPPEQLARGIRAAQQAFARAVVDQDDPVRAAAAANDALRIGMITAEQLTRHAADSVLQARHRHYAKLGTLLGSSAGYAPLPPANAERFAEGFNYMTLPLSWRTIAPCEGDYLWEVYDAQLDWCVHHQLLPKGGPLIELSGAMLPDWIWLWEEDYDSIQEFVTDFVTATIRRYQGRIRIWEVISRANSANLLGLSEAEVLRLAVQALQVARQVDPEAYFLVGLDRPWADYMAHSHHQYAPIFFVDSLIRAELGLAALGIEVAMGFQPDATYPRDTFEFARMLDLYAGLGLPIHVTLAAPSALTPDPLACREVKPGQGTWHAPWDEAVQADWAEQFATVALSKPFVQAVTWCHWTDATAHHYPNAGLVRSDGRPKPALERLKRLRKEHLR